MNHSPIRFGLALCYGLSALLVLLLFYGCAAVTAEPASVEAPRAAASASLECSTRADLVTYLAERYGEAIVARALTLAEAKMFEVFASPGGETWTIIITMSSGCSAVLTAGTDWQELNPQPEGTSL